jgi:hypothetical protein
MFRRILGVALVAAAVGCFTALLLGGPYVYGPGSLIAVIAFLTLIGLSGPSTQWKADDLVRADEHDEHQMSPGPAPPGADGGTAGF